MLAGALSVAVISFLEIKCFLVISAHFVTVLTEHLADASTQPGERDRLEGTREMRAAYIDRALN